MDAEKIKNALKGKRRNVVLTDEVKEVIHNGVNEGLSVREITTELNRGFKKGEVGYIPYQYVYNYLSRLLKKLEKK